MAVDEKWAKLEGPKYKLFSKVYRGIALERMPNDPNITTDVVVGEFEFCYDGSTIAAFELLIQTLQETLPGMKAAAIE